MISLLNQTLGMILALAVLLTLLISPLVALWIALSIRLSLRRIADAVSPPPSAQHVFSEAMPGNPEVALTTRERNIANSLFGRKY
jgi:hypothetical protein